MVEWISNARLGEAASCGSVFSLNQEKVGLSIHKLIRCGDELYLNCYPLGIENLSLNTNDFNEAVERAKRLVADRLRRLQELYVTFLTDTTGATFVKR